MPIKAEMPILSVIIPSHNRAHYAISTIKSILHSCGDVEVIVSDTSIEDLITPAFAGINADPRLKILRPGKSLSVVENFEHALSAARGTYLTFIGDDDFVSPDICDVAKWAHTQGIDAIKNTFPVFYFWPDFKSTYYGDSISGTLRISKFSGQVSSHDPKDALDFALESFGTGVIDMPRAYSGIISKMLSDSIVKKYGQLFGGVSPDIYSAALISIESKHCVKIDYPLIVPGASQVSTGGLSKQGKHIGKLRDNNHIGAFKDLVWDERIPEFYSVPTVWAYSLLKAVERAGYHVDKINYMRLYLKCFIYHPRYTKFITLPLISFARKAGWIHSMLLLLKALVLEAWHIARRVFNKFFVSRTTNITEIIARVESTEHAALELAKHLEKYNKHTPWSRETLPLVM